MPNPERPLTPQDIQRLALDAQIRAERDTDEHGQLREGLEHSNDVAQIAGRMAVTELGQSDPEWDWSANDTDDFNRVRLGLE